MPLYEYHCESCGLFTQWRSLAECSRPAPCPTCARLASKTFAGVNLSGMRPENRVAWERNERSAHAPHVCGQGCAHTSPRAKLDRAAAAKNLAPRPSTKPNSRPWMLGH